MGDFFCARVCLCALFSDRSSVRADHLYPHLILIQLSHLLSSHLQQKGFINKSNNSMSELGLIIIKKTSVLQGNATHLLLQCFFLKYRFFYSHVLRHKRFSHKAVKFVHNVFVLCMILSYSLCYSIVIFVTICVEFKVVGEVFRDFNLYE